VRKEVRTARLLGEREHGARAEAEHEAKPGAARRTVAEQEIHGQQGEAGGRMCAGEACGMTQRVRPVREQRHIRKAAAEGRKVPRAIDVGELLEQSGEPVGQREREHEIKQWPPPGREQRAPAPEQQREQRAEPDRAYQVAATCMHDAARPERVAREPAAGGRIEEQPRHHNIEMQSGEQEHRHQPGSERPHGEAVWDGQGHRHKLPAATATRPPDRPAAPAD